MATQLKNILAFNNVAAGAFATLPHSLNYKGLGLVPDKLQLDNANFAYISADNANVTVQNNDVAPASCNVLVEHWHTIERTFGPDSVVALSPQPFVPAIGGGGGGGGTDRYSPPEKWYQENIPGGQANVDLSALVSVSFDTIKMIRAGSIVGLSTRFTQAITDANAGSAIITVTVNGASGTLSISHDAGSNPTGGEATQAPAVDTFVAGDLLGVEITTLATFAPTTNKVEAWLDLQF